jgi:hypothetical protein
MASTHHLIREVPEELQLGPVSPGADAALPLLVLRALAVL